MDKQYLIRDDHIGMFKDFMPNELIDHYMNYFNNCEKQGIVFPRKVDETFVSFVCSKIFLFKKIIYSQHTRG